MNELFARLIGSGTLNPGDEGVRLALAHPLPAWGWALVGLAAAGLGYLCYRRLEGARSWRTVLGVLRTLLLVLLAVLLAGPMLTRARESEERDWVLVLVDRSASLNVTDAPGPGGTRTTRQAQLEAALRATEPTWSALAAERAVVWLGFDASAYDLPLDTAKAGAAGAAVPIALGTPSGLRTDLGGAIDAALRRAAARPISGIVVLSDGRSTDAIPRPVLRRLEAERIPVFTVALGSERGVSDLAVRRAEAPRFAFVRDSVPVQVELERVGGEPGTAEDAVVELVDNASGSVLDRREVSFDPAGETGESRASVTLTSKPSVAGQTAWSVRVRPGGGDGAGGGVDLVEANNRAEFSLELIDRPLRIAYFDGYPRWEYRFLKTLLVREPSLESVVMLLAPGRRYLQEGTITLDSLPRSPEEWAKFDVIVLGDMVPGVFTNDQLAQIRERVSTAGTGLVWIGGESATPGAWRGTALADLLPFAVSEAGGEAGGGSGAGGTSGNLPVWDVPVVMRATPAAERLGVLRLADEPVNGLYWPARLSSPETGWSLLRNTQRIEPGIVKPTAEVLANAEPVRAGGVVPADATPLVLSMRYGAGRVVYVGTDEIWRWRYGQGERLPERFWLQVIRLLGRESVARQGRAAVIEATPARAEINQPVRVRLTLLDQTLVDAAPPTVRVRVVSESGGGESPPVELTLTPEAGAGPTTARSGRATTRSFAGTFLPSEAGRYRVEGNDPLLASALGGGALATGVEVWRPDDEMRQPQADHAALASLSQQTQGKVLSTGELAQLPRLLPNRRVRITGEPEIRTLWDTPLALVLVVLLLTLEWVGRRVLRYA